MNDRKYLLKVLGLSSGPRIFTSLLTLFSFPIMLRAVGPSEYGVIVYLGAVIGIFESFVDFGVSSAAGKGIAEAKVTRPQFLRTELNHWVRLQTILAIIGLLPLLGVSYLFVHINRTIEVRPFLLLILSLSAWLAIAANFARTCLRSYLAFGTLAILDSVESVVRSASFLIVAWLVPTAMGLAVAGLITVIIAGSLCCWSLIIVSRKQITMQVDNGKIENSQIMVLSQRFMIKESLSFLGLRLSTRAFQSFPLILFGQLLGAEIVGIISAFTKILEIIGFPFITFGNALSVKAQEVKAKGLIAITELWNTCFRFIVLVVIFTGIFFLASGSIAHILMPYSADAAVIFSIMSIMTLTQSTSSIVSPLSDYIGGLRKRMAYLGFLAIIQIPLLFIGAVLYKNIGAIISYMIIQLFMIGGYIIIAKRVFFGNEKYVLPRDIFIAFCVILIVFVFTLAIKSYLLLVEIPFLSENYRFINIILFFLLSVFSIFFMIKTLKAKYLTLSLFEF